MEENKSVPVKRKSRRQINWLSKKTAINIVSTVEREQMVYYMATDNNMDESGPSSKTFESNIACNKFKFVGGKDTPDTTRRILNRLMTNELAVITNWTGRNNKNGFKDMKNIIKLIHVSVRNNPLITSTTLEEVENVIKGWLRSASDREGGRARRFSKKLYL